MMQRPEKCAITTPKPTPLTPMMRVAAKDFNMASENSIVATVVPVVFAIMVPAVLLIFLVFFFYRNTKKGLKRILRAHLQHMNDYRQVEGVDNIDVKYNNIDEVFDGEGM